MVQPGLGGALDTPRTNLGDATYLSRQPDLEDVSIEVSFQSPSKDNNNIVSQLRNGRAGALNLRTPRSRGILADRRDTGLNGGIEFTPMLKSAIRQSARRYGKENGATSAAAVPATPGAIDRIDEDITALPRLDASVYSTSRHTSYIDNTLPEVDDSTDVSTPLAISSRRPTGAGAGSGTGSGARAGAKDPLQDGKQLSLREQENVIDRIEKENFGLKLKIHFLEDSLHKAGPGFGEAALRENTELKVDKVTMQRELKNYKKHLTAAERDLESYRQQMLDLQDRVRRKQADEGQRVELETLRQTLQDREADIEALQQRLDARDQDGHDRIGQLQDKIGDLEADGRDKDRLIGEHEDEADELREKLQQAEARTGEAENKAKTSQRRAAELEQKLAAHDGLEGETKNTISELQRAARQTESRLEDMREKLERAMADKDRAEGDLEELQEEMANKSVVTKGLSRQREEKVVRLQDELDQAGLELETVERKYNELVAEAELLRTQLKELRRENEGAERDRKAAVAKAEAVKADLESRADENRALQARNEKLAAHSVALEQEMGRLEKEAQNLEEDLGQERDRALELEMQVREQARADVDRLRDEMAELQAEIRDKDSQYDNESERWEAERRTVESARDRAEERAAGLQRTVDALREAEGTLTNKEAKLQEAAQSESQRHRSEEGVLTRQIDELTQALEARQAVLTELRSELSGAREELRQKRTEAQTQADRADALEDEVEVLQTTLDEETEQWRKEVEAARGERDDFRRQLDALRRTTIVASAGLQSPRRSAEAVNQLERQLSDAAAQLAAATREKQGLHDELHGLRQALAEARAAREEAELEARLTRQSDEQTIRLDQERIDLRTAKIRLDAELRRLRDENRLLAERKDGVEKSLEDEAARAAGEEERLGVELQQLQQRVRQSESSEAYDLAAARRTIRELERRIEEFEKTAASATAGEDYGEGSQGGQGDKGGVTPMRQSLSALIEGDSELATVRRDLTTARQRELDHVKREASHKDAIRTLKRRVAELERQAHEAEVGRLAAAASPAPSLSVASDASSSARKREIVELRHQLATAQQTGSELKAKLRDAERRVSQTERDGARQLDEVRDEKQAAEQALEDARRDAEDAALSHQTALRTLRARLDRERKTGSVSLASRREGGNNNSSSDLRELLRQANAETDALEHDVRAQQALIDGLNASEAALRRKMERARSERAAYRLTAEKLQRDVKVLKAAAEATTKMAKETLADQMNVKMVKMNTKDKTRNNNNDYDTANSDTTVREQRHVKELRGMVMQMEWMQARWEREALMRADAAYAKKFLQLQLEVANACNDAQLRELERIRKDVLGSKDPLPPSLVRQQQQKQPKQQNYQNQQIPSINKSRLRAVLAAVRFMVRARAAAAAWATHEETRRKIVRCVEDMKRRRGMVAI